MPQNFEELAALISRRDGISMEEAYSIVYECQDELNHIFAAGGSLNEIEDTLADYLGLELDYFDLFI